MSKQTISKFFHRFFSCSFTNLPQPSPLQIRKAFYLIEQQTFSEKLHKTRYASTSFALSVCSRTKTRKNRISEQKTIFKMSESFDDINLLFASVLSLWGKKASQYFYTSTFHFFFSLSRGNRKYLSRHNAWMLQFSVQHFVILFIVV